MSEASRQKWNDVTLIGTAAGWPGVCADPANGTMLFGVTPRDVGTFATVSLVRSWSRLGLLSSGARGLKWIRGSTQVE